MGHAAAGILHLVNDTPVDWCSKYQATVETVAFGSEFIAARIVTDQIIDLHTTLCYLESSGVIHLVTTGHLLPVQRFLIFDLISDTMLSHTTMLGRQ